MTAINGTAQTVDDIINLTIIGAVLPAVEAAIKVAVPFLAAPIASEILDLVLEQIANEIYNQLSLIATIDIVIPLQVGSETSEYLAAEGALRKAHLGGKQSEIDQATKGFENAVQNLVKWDGSASP